MNCCKLLAGLVALLVLFAPNARAAQAETVADAESTDPAVLAQQKREQQRIESVWDANWRRFATYYIKHGNLYVCVPGYDRKFPSSTGISINAYRKETQWEQPYTDERGTDRKRTLTKPEPEARAAVALLPKVEKGQYGYIHSGKIEEIVDDKTVELKEIWLLDRDAVSEDKDKLMSRVREGLVDDIEDAIRKRERTRRGDGIAKRRRQEREAIERGFEDREDAVSRQRGRAYRSYTWQIIGYQTGKLTEDARWPSGRAAETGLQLVIVDVEDRVVTAVPAARVGKDITELDFSLMLDARGFDKAKFVELVTESRRKSFNDYIPLVLAGLEGDADIRVDDEQDDGPNDIIELAD